MHVEAMYGEAMHGVKDVYQYAHSNCLWIHLEKYMESGGVKYAYEYPHSHQPWIFRHLEKYVEGGVRTLFMYMHGLYICPQACFFYLLRCMEVIAALVPAFM